MCTPALHCGGAILDMLVAALLALLLCDRLRQVGAHRHKQCCSTCNKLRFLRDNNKSNVIVERECTSTIIRNNTGGQESQ